MKPCPICSARREPLFNAVVRNEYSADYGVCPKCGLIQPEDPVWLDEAYSSALADIDTGVIARNLHCIKILAVLVYTMFDKNGRFLDYGGGHGLLTRAMRDIGFDYYCYDRYADNLFAKGFDGSIDSSYHAVSAFEVLEHIPDPLSLIDHLLKYTSNIVLSTESYRGDPPRPDAWPYYAFNSGQHVSFFKTETLEFIAKKFGCHLLSNGFFHILSRHKMNPFYFSSINNKILYNLLFLYIKRSMKSKTFNDFSYLTKAISESSHESDV